MITERSVVQFDFNKHVRFFPGTLISSFTNTRPAKDGALLTFGKISSVITGRIIQCKQIAFFFFSLFLTDHLNRVHLQPSLLV